MLAKIGVMKGRTGWAGFWTRRPGSRSGGQRAERDSIGWGKNCLKKALGFEKEDSENTPAQSMDGPALMMPGGAQSALDQDRFHHLHFSSSHKGFKVEDSRKASVMHSKKDFFSRVPKHGLRIGFPFVNQPRKPTGWLIQWFQT